MSGVDKSLRGTKGFFNSDETIPPLFLMKLAGSLVESLKMQAFNQNDKIYIEQGTWPDIFVKAIAIYCKSKQLEPGYSGGYEFEQDSLNSKKSLEFVPTKIQADIYKEAIRLEKGPALLEPTDEKSKPKPGFKLGS